MCRGSSPLSDTNIPITFKVMGMFFVYNQGLMLFVYFFNAVHRSLTPFVAMSSTALPLAFYLHTHWDREWYETHTCYTLRLLTVLNQCVDALEQGEVNHVVLDGQTSLLEDTLSYHDAPEALSAKLKTLVSQGKLSIGPWYVMPDSFLCHPETLRQNLKLGMAQAQAWGQSLETCVGYLPDTFGHPACIPQLLQEVGIKYAIVWRGLRNDAPNVCYWRTEEHAASLLTLKLTGGYFQPFLHGKHWWENPEEEALALPYYLQDPLDASSQSLSEARIAGYPFPNLPQALQTFIEALQACHPECLTMAGIPPLLPVGGDHLGMPVMSHLKAMQRGGVLASQATSLHDYLHQVADCVSSATQASLPTYTGKLMAQPVWHDATSPSAPALLTGVWSSRLWLKQWHKRLEWRLVIQIPQLLQAFAHAEKDSCGKPTTQDYFAREIRYTLSQLEGMYTKAWRFLLENTPHDTLCGCSVDAVHQEQAQRYQHCETLLDTVYRHARTSLVQTSDPTLTLACYEPYTNPITWAVETLGKSSCLKKWGDSFYEGTLLWHEETNFSPDTPTPSADARHDQAYIPTSRASWHQAGYLKTHLETTTYHDTNRVPLSHRWATTQETPHWLAVSPPMPYAPYRRTEALPLTGQTPLPEGMAPVSVHLDTKASEGVGVWTLAHGTLKLKVNPSEGTLYVETPTQRFQVFLVGVCDAGDSYNRSAQNPRLPMIGFDIASVSPWVRHAQAPDIAQGLTLTLSPSRTQHPVTQEPLPTVYLHWYLEAHRPVIHAEVSFVNTAKDWRLQCVWKPESGFRPEPVSPEHQPSLSLEAGTPWETPWTFQPEQYTVPVSFSNTTVLQPWREWLPLTFPVHTHFTTAYGTWFSEGLTEWEYFPACGVDATQATHEAFGCTLHRGFGWLSHPDTGTRYGNAGPYIPTPEGQGLNRPLRYRFAYGAIQTP